MPSSRDARSAFAWLVVGHAAVDAYALVVPFLTPILLARLVAEESQALYAGAFAAAVALSTSFGQTAFGFFADRAGSTAFMWAGLAVAAVGMGCLGLAPTLPVALIVMGIGGLGVAAFHPTAVVAAGRLAGKARGSGISIFLTGGNIGQAIGPFLLILALARWGPSAFVWSIFPGLVLALLLARFAQRAPATPRRSPNQVPHQGDIPYGPLTALFLLVTIRTVTVIGFLYFLAIYLSNDLALNNIPRAAIQAGFIFLGSMGILLGGWLSDRMPRMPLLVCSIVLPVPLLMLALRVDTAPFVVLLLIGNFLMQAASPIYVVLAQEVMPGRQNVASSVAMGAAWGAAGLLALPLGAVAGHFGLVPVLTSLAALPLLALPLLLVIDCRQAVQMEVPAG